MAVGSSYNNNDSEKEELIAKLASANQELAREKKRHELYKLIPVSHPIFINKLTGQFDEQKYHDAVERRLNGTMSMEEIADMYDVPLPSHLVSSTSSPKAPTITIPVMKSLVIMIITIKMHLLLLQVRLHLLHLYHHLVLH